MLKRKRCRALAILLLLSLMAAPAALAEESMADTLDAWWSGAKVQMESWGKSTGTIEVKGQAVRTVAPDTVSIRLGASIENEDEKEALAQAGAAINAALEAFRALGVEDSQIVTNRYSVARRTQRSQSRLLPDTYTYVARISLRITLSDFDLMNAVIDAGMEAGVNEIDGLDFSLSNEGEVYRQALRDAVETARLKAEIMAEAAGAELTALLDLRESSWGGATVNAYAAADMDAMEESASTGAQVMGGEIQVSATVEMKYQTR